MSERDELARLLMSDEIMNVPDIGGFDYALHEADVLLKAGYRKPRRAWSLGNLPHKDGTVIRTAHGKTLERIGGRWLAPDSKTYWAPIVEWLPATVLYEPTP